MKKYNANVTLLTFDVYIDGEPKIILFSIDKMIHFVVIILIDFIGFALIMNCDIL